MSEWESTTIGEIASRITKGTTPRKGRGFAETGICYIKSDALSYDGKIDTTKFVCIDEDTHESLKRSKLQKDDILFSMAGVFLGKCGLVSEEMLPGNTNQAVAIIRLKQDLAFPQFVNFFLRQKAIIEYVNNMSGQSAQPNINFQEIASIDISLPPLPEQKAIASVLSSLDDKIDLLHRQNKTLEAMAETLFRQWFVVEGATTCNITEFVEFNPKRQLAKNTIAPYLEMANVSTTVFHPEDWYDREFKSGTKFINGDTLLARITPCLENGKSTFVSFLNGNQVGWGSTEFIVIRSKDSIHPFFTYVLARNDDFRGYAKDALKGQVVVKGLILTT